MGLPPRTRLTDSGIAPGMMLKRRAHQCRSAPGVFSLINASNVCPARYISASLLPKPPSRTYLAHAQRARLDFRIRSRAPVRPGSDARRIVRRLKRRTYAAAATAAPAAASLGRPAVARRLRPSQASQVRQLPGGFLQHAFAHRLHYDRLGDLSWRRWVASAVKSQIMPSTIKSEVDSWVIDPTDVDSIKIAMRSNSLPPPATIPHAEFGYGLPRI